MKVSRLFYYAALAALAAPAMRADTFAYTGTIVSWTVPTTGTYLITAIGAQGGEGTDCCGFVGGLGAEIEGTFSLTAGTVLEIAVGGEGQSSDGNGGGGGGSFVVDSSNNPLVIAGGGGGIRTNAGQDGTNASITEFAYDASGGSPIYTPVLKSTGLGQGGIVSSPTWGSAGAGFNSNGASDTIGGGTGGSSWFNGLAGGAGNPGCLPAAGGFGGGGSGNGCDGGGGGGGYSGGDGGFVAGGGGSYNAGADPFALAGAGVGNGSVDIDLQMAAVPEPGSILLLATVVIVLFRFSSKWRRGLLG
jgi:hypothetical protein